MKSIYNEESLGKETPFLFTCSTLSTIGFLLAAVDYFPFPAFSVFPVFSVFPAFAAAAHGDVG